ncbi:hypothetical protein BDF14DRAFT_1774955 [Spinellus fusiger]|nr:hypothetical protein BDF14DRAFT_1774955 [Spinellus fusiger]
MPQTVIFLAMKYNRTRCDILSTAKRVVSCGTNRRFNRPLLSTVESIKGVNYTCLFCKE